MPRRAAHGFTLLELLVATALFAVVASLAYGGLNQLARQGAQVQAEAGRLGDLQRAVDRLVSDLRAAVPRPIRDAAAGRVPVLIGSAHRIEFTRGGYGNRLAAPRAELERVAWTLHDGQLQRLHYAALDRATSIPQRAEAWLDGVESLHLSYLDANGRESTQWPVANATDRFPAAVRIQLQVGDFGQIERLVELPQGGSP